ncbi:hypothetical protein [uncultured Modestobacter sp.]|uniref:hypothetical protein n=1 Tax=uncultured Modestobacter sp. TaxID=380048 RepID=UPI0026041B16|nr:hypothetical protein [uncultured Modestobacter sp.]
MSRSRSSRTWRLVGAVAVALALVAGGYLVTRPDGATRPSTGAAATTGAPSPTGTVAETDVPVAAASTTVGQQLSGLEPAPGSTIATDAPVPTGAAATAVLAYLDWNADADGVEAAGYVSGVIEDGGSCTLVLTRDGVSVTAELSGMADASTTVCGGFTVPAAQLSPGTWNGVLQYSSGSADVASPAQTLVVPSS